MRRIGNDHIKLLCRIQRIKQITQNEIDDAVPCPRIGNRHIQCLRRDINRRRIDIRTIPLQRNGNGPAPGAQIQYAGFSRHDLQHFLHQRFRILPRNEHRRIDLKLKSHELAFPDNVLARLMRGPSFDQFLITFELLLIYSMIFIKKICGPGDTGGHFQKGERIDLCIGDPCILKGLFPISKHIT